MSTHLIDGKTLAKKMRSEIKDSVGKVTSMLGRSPRLCVVLVGENPASKIYVAAKTRHAKSCNMDVEDILLSETVGNQELCDTLRKLSLREDIDGILLQLPLPDHLDEFLALLSISPEKDVDGLHPYNQGLLLRGEECLKPCTPSGAIDLIKDARKALGEKEDLSGLHAVVIGRSMLVGRPLGLLLLEENCTVTFCHSRTQNLAEVCSKADIIIPAIGKPEFVDEDFIKPGAIVIDVGINRKEDGSIVGDVNFNNVVDIAAAITPVPGGVGPMTIATLLKNTLTAAGAKCNYRETL